MLVQLVCLDRRYQRMNCYNIREIQTILKSKYSPNTAESSDVRFGLEETILGLRFQLNGIEFIDPSFILFYKNALINNTKFDSIHTYLNKPIFNSNGTQNFMLKSSLMYSHITNYLYNYTSTKTLSANSENVTTFTALTPTTGLEYLLMPQVAQLSNVSFNRQSIFSIFNLT